MDDLLQEAFLRIHQNLEGLQDKVKLNAWVHQIARNLIVDHYRTRPVQPSQVDLETWRSEDPDDARDELIGCIEPFIDQLPETYREAVRMSELQGLTQAEVAARLGLSVSGAKSRVQRGRKVAKEMLDACCLFHKDSAGRVNDYRRKSECDCA